MGQAAEDARSPHDGLTTGERIRLLRNRRKLTLRELADATGLSFSVIASYEKDATEPSGRAIRALALALGTSADYLLTLKPTPSYVTGKARKRGDRDLRPMPSVQPKDPLAKKGPSQTAFLALTRDGADGAAAALIRGRRVRDVRRPATVG